MKPQSQPEPPSKPAAGTAQPQEEPMLYCPRCNAKLSQLKCKLLCERCGYYMSCADYY